MIERMWFAPRWYDRLLWPLLWPLSCLYGSISRYRRQQFVDKKSVSYRSSLPTIVVGNITVGGNGKTPVVLWLVEWLQANGYRPGVVSRGYGAKAPYYPYQVDNTALATEVGDEPLLIHQRTGVPVVVAPKRADAVRTLETLGVDIVVTDDGLQHYGLQRDIEIVVVDGQRRFGTAHYMPLGPLREDLSRLTSVDFVISNGGECQPGEYQMQLTPQHWVNVKTGERRALQYFERGVAMAGIGHPPRFFDTVTRLGVQLDDRVSFADHQPYVLATLTELTPNKQPLLMTEKDAVKCRQFAQDNWWYLPVVAQMDSDFETAFHTKLNKYKDNHGPSTS